MPTPQQTERPIEKLLRAFAKKRREEGNCDLEMSPNTRRLLQAEVARKFGAPASASRRAGWSSLGLWPKPAWGLVGGVALLFGIWLLWPPSTHHQPQTLLAQNKNPNPVPQAKTGTGVEVAHLISQKTELRDKTILAPQQSPVGELLPATRELDQSKTALQLALAPPAESGVVAAKEQLETPAQSFASSKPASTATLSVAKDSLAELQSTAAPAPGPSAAGLASANQAETPGNVPARTAMLGATVAPLQRIADEGSSGSTTGVPNHLEVLFKAVPGQYSAKALALKAKKGTEAFPSVAAVLASFKLEQTGRQLRMVDHDGSIYSGYLQPGFAGGAQGPPRRTMSNGIAHEEERQERSVLSEAVGAPSLTPQSYFFSVTGTNVSLNQRVDFVGKLENTDANPQAAATLQQPSRGFQALPNQASQSMLVNQRVSGKAVVGGTTEITTEAIASLPGKNN
jgi:hypothetical protein